MLQTRSVFHKYGLYHKINTAALFSPFVLVVCYSVYFVLVIRKVTFRTGEHCSITTPYLIVYSILHHTNITRGSQNLQGDLIVATQAWMMSLDGDDVTLLH